MRVSMDLRPTRLLLGAGALALAFAIGAGVATGDQSATPAAPAAPALAATVDDVTAASSALGIGGDATLVAAVGVDGTVDQRAAAAPRGAGILRAIVGKTERAEITVTTADGQKTILYVRGSFTAASATSVTVTLKDGSTQAFTIDATTKVRSAGKPKAVSDIKTTGHGLVLGVKNADGSFSAKFVRIAPAS